MAHPANLFSEAWLEHNGVKGMKWGVRKNGVSTAKRRPAPKSEDKADADALKKKSAASLSNKELKRLNERLQLERQYSDLKQSDRSIKTGYKAVKGIVAVAGTATAVYGLATNPAVKDIRRAMESVGTAVIAARGMYG